MFQGPAWLRPLLPAPKGRVSQRSASERPSDMRHLSIALGTCVAALAVTAGPALAQNATPSTYQAARAAGAAAQKVAPPNLVMPADMGGGTYSSRATSGNASNNTNESPPSTMNNSAGKSNGTLPPSGGSPAPADNTNNPNNATSPNPKPGS